MRLPIFCLLLSLSALAGCSRPAAPPARASAFIPDSSCEYTPLDGKKLIGAQQCNDMQIGNRTTLIMRDGPILEARGVPFVDYHLLVVNTDPDRYLTEVFAKNYQLVPASACDKVKNYHLALPRFDEQIQQIVHGTGCFVRTDLTVTGPVKPSPIQGHMSIRNAIEQTIRATPLYIVDRQGDTIIVAKKP